MKKDLRIYYSVELSFQFNVTIGAVCRPLSMGGGEGLGYGFRPGWVWRSGKSFKGHVLTDIIFL